MSHNYQILFEPVQIGPVTSPNRFFQVAHCNGMGHRYPNSLATMRGIKAEGGWGVVCTEEVEIHHSSDLAPFHEGRLWDERDIRGLAMMAESVKKFGALPAIELVYSGLNAPNHYSRVPALGPSSMSVIGGTGYEPIHARRIDRADIRNIRRWHRNAAIRAMNAGFDIVYCYAGHGLTLPMHFMLKRYNDRHDEYGGSLENRVRFFREIIEDTKEAVGHKCAVAVRFAVDELIGPDGMQQEGEGHDIVAMLAELPDLWDVNISSWSNDSATSRFAKEGYQEPYIKFVKSLTSKPVVGVGRYTSPDSMVSAIRRGVMDLIGAARPSIADPFLPNKIKTNRLEEIRECIGCNICVSSDYKCVPVRCTQNPTMGEEWRKGWHPERISPKRSDQQVLVVGAGPSGLECARALGQRGYDVTLVDAERELGGRVQKEFSLPGLSEWRRVAEWRITMISKMKNIEVFPASRMSAEDVLATGIKNIFVATGARYRRDGIGRNIFHPIPGSNSKMVLTPDDIMSGQRPVGEVVIYDDDHYYMGGVIAGMLADLGVRVTVITPAPMVSYWTQFTLEQEKIEAKLRKSGVKIFARHIVTHIADGRISAQCQHTESEFTVNCHAIILVSDRIPNSQLADDLKSSVESGAISFLRSIGDCEAPGTIAHAVYAGHLAAREFEELIDPDVIPFRVERTEILAY
jgi:dimethylamine/trimethylamine dehydrogenase